MYKIGLLGSGTFGKAIQNWLADTCTFSVYDKDTYPENLQNALSQEIIVLAIPAQFLEDFLVTNKNLLNPKALYIDVCSVKIEPVKVMIQHLPQSAQIIATHPLFGPQSAKLSLSNQPMMIYPVRTTNATFKEFIRFLESLELQLIEATPEEHDKVLAYAQGLSHYIGRIMQEMKIPNSAMATQAYKDLLDMKNIQGADSDALFSSIVHTNPFTADVLKDFNNARLAVEEKFNC
jgi:prephenate dehydrogenase